MFLAKELVAKGMQVKVVGLFSCNTQFMLELKEHGIEADYCEEIGSEFMAYFKKDILGKVRFWVTIVKWLRSEKPGVIMPYTQSIDNFINAIWRFSGAKLSFSFERGGHNNPKREKASWTKMLKKWSKPAYVSNSIHGAEAMSIIRNIPIENIHVIPNGYEAPKLTSSATDSTFVGEIVKGKVVFLMIANFFDQKNHLFLLRAWKKALLDNSILLLAGMGGNEKCKQNFQLSKEFVHANGLEKEIIFLGQVDYTQALLQMADVGVLSSNTEGCPNAILEYMGAGLPIVSRDISGVREVISNQNLKWLADFNSPEDFAQKLKALENDNAQRKTLGAFNKKYVLKHFAPKKMFDAYDNILLNS